LKRKYFKLLYLASLLSFGCLMTSQVLADGSSQNFSTDVGITFVDGQPDHSESDHPGPAQSDHHSVGQGNVKINTHTKGSLPQTGEQSRTFYQVLGIILLIVGSFFYYVKNSRRKKKNFIK